MLWLRSKYTIYALLSVGLVYWIKIFLLIFVCKQNKTPLKYKYESEHEILVLIVFTNKEDLVWM